MKKVINFGALAISVGMMLYSCNKESVTVNEASTQNEEAYAIKARVGLEHEVEKRSYKWVDGKLDCSSDGLGCEVEAVYRSKDGDINLSEIQVLKLIEIGKVDLNQYFVRNDLRYEFPSIYEDEFFAKISSGEFKIIFEFPYMQIINSRSNLEMVYNYERTLSNDNVVSALRMNGGEYDKKAELNTDTDNPVVWKCYDPGDNCKTSAIRFNLDWVKSNHKYLFPPTIENIENVEVTQNENGKKILLKTASGKVYGIEL